MFRSIIQTLLSSILFLGCDSVKTATINGSLENISDKSISISIGSDARTLLKSKEDAFTHEIKEDGSFSFSIDFDAPIWITMVSDEYHFIGHILLISEGDNEIYADCNRLRETLEYSGANGTLNTFYREWDEKYNEVLRELKSQGLDHSDWVSSLDSIELVGMERLHELQNETTLSINELRWLSSNIKYRKFSSLANRAYRAGSKPGDQKFDFFDKLNLNDEEACMVSKTYNRVIHDYVLYKVNLHGAFWDPAGDNTEFHELIYNTALKELSGKVRDVELNILVSDLLNSNNLEAPVYFEKFLKDCKTKDLHKMANQLYNDYVLLSNRELGPNVEIISTDNKAPLEVLTQFENKVLYLDFWAGWCSPCINSMPKTMELADHYQDRDAVVLFIGHRDEKENLEGAIKKHSFTGKHLILNNEETEVWSKVFDVGSIPSYVLLDRKHNVVDYHAPDPDNQLIFTMIDSLLQAH